MKAQNPASGSFNELMQREEHDAVRGFAKKLTAVRRLSSYVRYGAEIDALIAHQKTLKSVIPDASFVSSSIPARIGRLFFPRNTASDLAKNRERLAQQEKISDGFLRVLDTDYQKLTGHSYLAERAPEVYARLQQEMPELESRRAAKPAKQMPTALPVLYDVASAPTPQQHANAPTLKDQESIPGSGLSVDPIGPLAGIYWRYRQNLDRQTIKALKETYANDPATLHTKLRAQHDKRMNEIDGVLKTGRLTIGYNSDATAVKDWTDRALLANRLKEYAHVMQHALFSVEQSHPDLARTARRAAPIFGPVDIKTTRANDSNYADLDEAPSTTPKTGLRRFLTRAFAETTLGAFRDSIITPVMTRFGHNDAPIQRHDIAA